MMHSDQLSINLATARQMLFEQFPQYCGERVMAIAGSGTVNAIFKIGSLAAARFPLQGTDPAACLGMLQGEAGAMARFAACSPVPTPSPLGIGRPGPGYPMPWAVQSWVEGDIATPRGLADSEVLAGDIADLIERLRAADTEGRHFAGQGRGGRLRDHDDWIELCLANSQGLLDVTRLRSLWARLRGLPPSGADVMSHRDLIPANLLVRGERLVGVLDSGGFGPADRALDLVAAWHLFDRERRSAIRTRLGSSELEWRRGAGWAFQQAMGLVWYYHQSNAIMAGLGRSTLSRLLGDQEI